jgi:hypothetical protein
MEEAEAPTSPFAPLAGRRCRQADEGPPIGKLCGGVALGHLRQTQHPDLRCLAGGTEGHEALLADLGHVGNRGLQIIARIEIIRMLDMGLADLAGKGEADPCRY